MSASPRAPIRVRAARCIRTGSALSLAAILAACSSTQHASGPQVFAWLQPEPPAAASVHTAYVETADDGMSAPASNGDAASEDWITISQNDTPAVAPGDDDGLPVPMGPEEAGV
ncbi:MAG: hypothetical protein ACM3L9_03395, partial [Deltaproteobacteria bacterium]